MSEHDKNNRINKLNVEDVLLEYKSVEKIEAEKNIEKNKAEKDDNEDTVRFGLAALNKTAENPKERRDEVCDDDADVKTYGDADDDEDTTRLPDLNEKAPSETPDGAGTKKVWSWKSSEDNALQDERNTASEEANTEAERTKKNVKQKAEEKSSQKVQNKIPLNAEILSKRYGKMLGSLKLRMLIAAILILPMAYITIAPRVGFALSFSTRTVYTVLTVMQLCIIILGPDVIFEGIYSVKKLKPSASSLVMIAAAITLLHSVYSLAFSEFSAAAPYGVIPSMGIFACLFGNYCKFSAMRLGYRLASTTEHPYLFYRLKDRWEEGDIYSKISGKADDFIIQCESPDISQTAYWVTAPLIIIICAVLSAMAAIYAHDGSVILRNTAAVFAAAVPLSAAYSFAFPFKLLNRRIVSSGAAIASWKGTLEASKSGGVVIGDKDLYPAGNISISSMKIIGKNSVDKAVSYTATVLNETGCGMAKTFTDMMIENGGSFKYISGFKSVNGRGFSAEVQGDYVLVGSYEYIRAMNVYISDQFEIENAVYTAINSELVAIFVMNYVASRTVSEVLNAVNDNRELVPIIANRDFNITEAAIKTSFDVHTAKMLFSSPEESEQLINAFPQGKERPAAVICRDGVLPVSEVLLGAVKLKRRSIISVAMSVISVFIAIAITYFLIVSGNFAVASAANLFIYSLLWALPVLAVGSGVNKF